MQISCGTDKSGGAGYGGGGLVSGRGRAEDAPQVYLLTVFSCPARVQ